jgi:outer membrane lipoprotein-sorting protein
MPAKAGIHALLLLFLSSPAFGQPWSLPQLMHGLTLVKSASAQFTERKTIAMLSAPLFATGTLDYAAPDRMQKITVSPVPERFTLAGALVTMTGPDRQTHVFSLHADPLIGGLTTGILATLAGNLPALEATYTVQLSGGPASWQLVLRPKDPRLARFIAWMCISGTANRITEIDTENANGDHSEMQVAETISHG